MSVLRNLDPIAIYNRFIAGLAHLSVQGDPLERQRHQSFIGTHLLAGLAALAALPLYLVTYGPASIVEAIALPWLAAPAPIALMVARTGRLALGRLLIMLANAIVVVWIAAFTGGINSTAPLWLAILPIEAALSGSRSDVRQALAVSMGTYAAIAALQFAGMLPQSHIEPAAVGRIVWLMSLSVMVYAGLMALRIEAMHRGDRAYASWKSAQFRIVAENIGDLVTGHAANGDVLFVSPAVERLLALMPSAALGDGLFKRVHVADRPAYLTALSDAVVLRRPVQIEFRIKVERPDGAISYLWLEMRCRPIEMIDDNALGKVVVVGVTRDITDQKLQAAELARARELAEEASFSKTRFLANVSHELRTPLNAIIGFSDLLQSGVFGRFTDERQAEYVRLIHESGAHLLQVVNDILDMSKIESGNFDIATEPFDVAHLVESTRQMMAHQAADRGLRLTALVSDGLPELNADRRACKQILINLLSNAVKFTNPGGSIVVGARREDDVLAFFVRDTGIGISECDLGRLGMPFVQADSGYNRRHEGTGLGLSVVKGLATLHGGSLRIESRLDEGTCVTVRLPLTSIETETRRAPVVVTIPAADSPAPAKDPSRAAQTQQQRRA